MGNYGHAAVRATELLAKGNAPSAPAAWARATREVFRNKEAAQKKGCPRGAFLGLCEEGLVRGVLAAAYTKSRDNKRYALEAVRFLRRDPAIAKDSKALWIKVMNGEEKTENSQMDVVLTLWTRGLIVDKEI